MERLGEFGFHLVITNPDTEYDLLIHKAAFPNKAVVSFGTSRCFFYYSEIYSETKPKQS